MPTGWTQVPLESLAVEGSVTYGVVQPGQAVADGVPMVRVNNFRGFGLDTSDVLRISADVEAKYARTRLRADDVLVTVVGTVGQVAVVPHWLAGWNVARAVAVIRPRDARLTRWIALALRAPESQRALGVAANTTVQTTINLKDLRKLPVPLPEPNEREAIELLLGSLDDRIDLLRQTNATLEAIAQALFKSWFIDFDPVRAKAEGREPEGMDSATASLFPPEFEESALGMIPKGWRPGCIRDLADVVDCLHSKKPALLNEGRPYLQLNNIRDDGLLDAEDLAYISEADYAKWTSRIEVREGDCVITNVGRVGAVAQIPPSLTAAMGRNMTAIRLHSDQPYPAVLVELLLSPSMRAEIERQTDVGTILNALNVRSIPGLQFVLAPGQVLRAAESVLRPLRASMESNIERAAHLARVRDTLLPRLISGKLRLPEAGREIEEALA